MAEYTDHQLPRLQEYQQRFEKLMEGARNEFGRQAPEVLDKLAATAKSIGQRLEEMASEARRTQQEKEARPGSAGNSEPAPGPPDESPASSGEPGTAGA